MWLLPLVHADFYYAGGGGGDRGLLLMLLRILSFAGLLVIDWCLNFATILGRVPPPSYPVQAI